MTPEDSKLLHELLQEVKRRPPVPAPRYLEPSGEPTELAARTLKNEFARVAANHRPRKRKRNV